MDQKTCKSCQKAVDASLGTCPNCGWTFEVPSGTGRLSMIKPAPRPKIPCEVELACTFDRTGSSECFAVGIPLTFETIVRQVTAKARSVRVWVQTHGDRDDAQEPILLTNGGTADQAIQDVKSIIYDGGGDAPEHHLHGIENLLNLVPWSANPTRARGASLAFMTADTKQTPGGMSAAQLGAEIKRRGLLLYLVCEPTPTLQELCQAAGGLMFQITNTPDAAELQKISAQLAASLVATIAAGATVPMTVPAAK